MLGFWIILAHLIGDYVLQSDWMALEKTKKWWPAIAHGVTYTIPYAFITQSIWALAVIASTHIVIDHYRLARYICWAKNLPSPKAYRYPWSECKTTGFHDSRPAWLATWLMFIADNTTHLLLNALAILFL